MRARRPLAWLVAVVAALGLAGCDENDPHNICTTSEEESPIRALLIGLYCAGNKPAKNQPPTASFTMRPNPVTSGDTVVFDASASTDPEGDAIEYSWDLDGVDDAFEVTSGKTPVLEQPVFSSSAAAESRTIRLSVSDSSGATAVRAATLEISPGILLAAAFSISPSPAFVGQPVQVDASASTGAVDYAWKFEHEGNFSEPSASRAASHVYTSPGERIVVLRVRDSAGHAVETSRVVNVRAAGADAAAVARAAARAPGRRFTARLTGVSFPVDPSAITNRGPVGALRGVRATGRLVARGRRLGALRRFRRARWVARLDLTASLRTRTATMRGLALATFPRGRGRACLSIAITARAGRRPRGKLRILGGRGAAGRLAGRARFRYRVEATGPRLRGRVRARARMPRPLPAACVRLR